MANNTYEVTRFIGGDDVPVIQIDTTDDTGRIRINLNEGVVWDGNPERDRGIADIIEGWRQTADARDDDRGEEFDVYSEAVAETLRECADEIEGLLK